MPAIKVDNAALKAFGRALKSADKELRKEMFKAVQTATKPVKEEIKRSAIQTLPSTGGLGTWVSKIGIRTRQAYSGRNVGITITGTLDNKKITRGKGRGKRKAGTFGATADLRAINRGRVMHPAWGRAKADGSGLFGPQMVKAGFWDAPLEGIVAVRARKEIEDAMRRVADEIAARARMAA